MQSWLLCIVKARNGFTLGDGWSRIWHPQGFFFFRWSQIETGSLVSQSAIANLFKVPDCDLKDFFLKKELNFKSKYNKMN